MRYKILIVDDSYINRELLKEMLKDEYDILEAENGKKALKMIEHKEQIDGILLDLIMPEINGFGVIEELSKKGIMKKVPVMIISSAHPQRCIHQKWQFHPMFSPEYLPHSQSRPRYPSHGFCFFCRH